MCDAWMPQVRLRVGQVKGILAGAYVPDPSLSTFTPGARRTLELARQEAPRLHHGFVGTDILQCRVFDGTSPSNVATVTINVTNSIPTANSDAYFIHAGQTLSVTAPGLIARCWPPSPWAKY